MMIVNPAPHPDLQDALFCLAYGGDGAFVQLLQGWEALVATVEADVAGDNWREALSDLGEWADDGWGKPTSYHSRFEDGYMTILRVHVPTPADQLAKGEHLEGDAKLTHQQCIAVADMAMQIARVHREFAAMIVAAPQAMPLSVTGPGSASIMELLGDIMNGMDAVTSEDEWTHPIFKAAHARWPSSTVGGVAVLGKDQR